MARRRPHLPRACAPGLPRFAPHASPASGFACADGERPWLWLGAGAAPQPSRWTRSCDRPFPRLSPAPARASRMITKAMPPSSTIAAANAIAMTDVDFVFDVSVEVVVVVLVGVVSSSTLPSVSGLPPPSSAPCANPAPAPADANSRARHSAHSSARLDGRRRPDTRRAYRLGYVLLRFQALPPRSDPGHRMLSPWPPNNAKYAWSSAVASRPSRR